VSITRNDANVLEQGMPTFTGRFRRGGGIPTPPKIPYFPEDAVKFFEGTYYAPSCDMVQMCFFFILLGRQLRFYYAGLVLLAKA
jgi:hypothetical protein